MNTPPATSAIVSTICICIFLLCLFVSFCAGLDGEWLRKVPAASRANDVLECSTRRLRVTEDPEAGDMGRAEGNGQSYGVDRNHGDGEVFDHDNIRLDKKFQEKRGVRDRAKSLQDARGRPAGDSDTARSRISVGHNPAGLRHPSRFLGEKLQRLRRRIGPFGSIQVFVLLRHRKLRFGECANGNGRG